VLYNDGRRALWTAICTTLFGVALALRLDLAGWVVPFEKPVDLTLPFFYRFGWLVLVRNYMQLLI
jgi:hypothetical protein